MEGKKERRKEIKRKKEPCHGIITVMGDMIDRFVRYPSVPAIHPSINSMNNGKENIRREERKNGKHGDHNILIFFPPPIPLSLFTILSLPFQPFPLFPLVGYGVR